MQLPKVLIRVHVHGRGSRKRVSASTVAESAACAGGPSKRPACFCGEEWSDAKAADDP